MFLTIVKSRRFVISSAFLSFIFFLSLFRMTVAQAQSATSVVSGYITDVATGESLIGASVSIVGTGIGTVANTSGFYSLPKAPVGKIQIKFLYLGYKPAVKTVNLEAGKAVSLNVGLTSDAVQAKEIVVEGKADEKREESVQTGLIKVQPLAVQQLPKIGETDLFRALKLLPGIKSGSEISSGLYIRGGAPDQNLILLDGNTVYNPNHLFGFFSTFNLDAVKDIQIIKGGFPAEYGGKMSAVVDVTDKDGNRNNWQGAGGVSIVASRLTLEAPLGDFGSAMISGRRTYLDILLSQLNKTSKDPLPQYYFYDLTGKINLDLSPKDKITISGYFGSDNLDYKLDANKPDKITLDWGNKTYSAKWGRLVTNQLFSQLIVSGSSYTANATNTISGIDARFNEAIRDYTIKNDWDYYATSDHSIKAGLFFTKYEFSVGSQFNGSFNQAFDAKPIYVGGYVQDNWKASVRLNVQAGLRYNYFSSGAYSRIEPRLSSTYSLTNDIKLKAAWGQYYQYTNLLALGNLDFIDIWTPVGPDLKPGKATQYILGVELPVARNLTLSVETYYKDLSNVTETKPQGQINFDTLSSSFYKGDGRAYGIEFFLQKQTGELTGWVGYTLSRTERSVSDIDNGSYFVPKYDRTHDLSATLSYNLGSNWRLGSNFVYQTGQAYSLPGSRYTVSTPDGTFDYVHPGLRNNARLEPYHRLDVNFDKSFTWLGMACDGSLNIYNVYNHRNVWYRSFDASDFTIPTKVQDVRLLPLIPTLEISFKF
jgi:outer membrane receptor protein involved in Fe transport